MFAIKIKRGNEETFFAGRFEEKHDHIECEEVEDVRESKHYKDMHHVKKVKDKISKITRIKSRHLAIVKTPEGSFGSGNSRFVMKHRETGQYLTNKIKETPDGQPQPILNPDLSKANCYSHRRGARRLIEELDRKIPGFKSRRGEFEITQVEAKDTYLSTW